MVNMLYPPPPPLLGEDPFVGDVAGLTIPPAPGVDMPHPSLSNCRLIVVAIKDSSGSCNAVDITV